MGKWQAYFLFLCWLSYLFVCGVLLFTRGFLLSRQALPNNATCSKNEACNDYWRLSEKDPSLKTKKSYIDCLDRDQLKLLHSTEYLCKSTRKKIILLVIDALRYDFTVYNTSLHDDERLPYQNRLPILYEILQTLPNNSRLFKFIANPPTTTLQRLKGLTTGSLPTFIDAGLNFGTPEISEDNILNQVVNAGKKLVIMGDDVWLSLFPRRSIREYTYPSFNIFDLDTVDNAVTKHLKRELYEKDWDLLIAHVLGVDHCGHAHGPNHREMTRKLGQMNSIIRDVVDTMDDDTLLFVIGDHGMTSTGDHGGESDDEVSAALFAYSPLPLLPREISGNHTSIYQVDLVPTMAFVLGTAIPYSNLGRVALELLPLPHVEDSPIHSHIPYAKEALAANIEQIMLYISTYHRQTHIFSREKTSSIASKFHDLRDGIDHVRDLQSFVAFRTKSINFLNFVREMFEEIWVQFDSFLMSRGLVLTFLLLTFTYIIVEGIPAETLTEILDRGFLFYAYGILILCAAGGYALQNLQYIDDGFLLTCVSSLTLSVFLMAVIVVQNWVRIASLGLQMYYTRGICDLLPRILYIFSLLLFFSNSFVVEEAQVLLFLLNSNILIIVASMSASPEPVSMKPKKDERSIITKLLAQPKIMTFAFALIFSMSLRLSLRYWRCREEQKWCTDGLNKSQRDGMETLATLALLGLFVSAVRMWLRGCGNLVGFSPGVMCARYAPSVIVVCTGGYWVLQSRGRVLVPWQLQLLPWTVFALVGIGVAAIVIKPLCVYVVRDKSDVLSVYGRENIIPQLFHQVKEVMRKPGEEKARVVYGLATVYSAVFVIIAEFFCLFVVLVLGDILASSAMLLVGSAGCLLFLLAYIRLEGSIVSAQMFHVPWPFIMSWGFLSSYFFYATGHQPTFPNIHWHAAFVGTSGQFNSNIFPAFLIGANTFCSHALLGLALPLLLVTPFTLFTMRPRWLHLSADKDVRQMKEAMWEELKQGELALFEKEGLMQHAAFKLCAKYLLFHSTRMFACMLAAAFHCRHLMVWKIFAPRFIFEGLAFFVTIGSVLLGYLLLSRVSSRIDRVITELLRKK